MKQHDHQRRGSRTPSRVRMRAPVAVPPPFAPFYTLALNDPRPGSSRSPPHQNCDAPLCIRKAGRVFRLPLVSPPCVLLVSCLRPARLSRDPTLPPLHMLTRAVWWSCILVIRLSLSHAPPPIVTSRAASPPSPAPDSFFSTATTMRLPRSVAYVLNAALFLRMGPVVKYPFRYQTCARVYRSGRCRAAASAGSRLPSARRRSAAFAVLSRHAYQPPWPG